jgi:ABC-2 type transport system permease protein
MGEFEAIYQIWLRDLIRYTRDKSRIASSLVQPILFLTIFGGGFGFVNLGGGVNYQSFLFPGIVIMALVFSSISSGISIIFDREFGFLKEILVAPVSRISIFAGKALGGTTTGIIQGLIILSLSFLLHIPITADGFLLALGTMVVTSVGVVSLGLIIASLIDSFESFGLIMNFLIFPLVFLSGAIFPLSDAPQWLKYISYMDPVTYGVECMRGALIGVSFIPFPVAFMVISAFSLAAIVIGGIAFNRQK